ncbi:MAG: helix-turn-helix domain-containing protein [Bacteroidia bacterium]|nr:helix-turn-helix domain-containing protein [Bacteroidia bacterium]
MSKIIKEIHHGKLLKELVAWSGLTQNEFATRIKMSRIWLSKAFKKEILSPKNLMRIMLEYKVPKDYWEGKVELPSIGKEVSKDEEEYQMKYEALKVENENLKDELIRLQKKLINVFQLVEALRIETKIDNGNY